MARWLRPRKVALWISALVGLALIVSPSVLAARNGGRVFPKISMALGLIVLVTSWGMICIQSWFSEGTPGFLSRKLHRAFPRTYVSGKRIMEWYASIFLMLWLTAGVVVAVALLIKF